MSPALALVAVALASVGQVPDQAGFRVVATIPVGKGPHGIRFSEDGRTAFVAVSGDDQVAVIDLQRHRVVRRLPAGKNPLDLIRIGKDWLVTQFQGDQLIRLGNPAQSVTVGTGPSLFAPRADSLGYLVSEFSDSLTLVDLTTGLVREAFRTGKRPYPADADDGVGFPREAVT